MGPIIFVDLSADSSPVVVTSTVNSPRSAVANRAVPLSSDSGLKTVSAVINPTTIIPPNMMSFFLIMLLVSVLSSAKLWLI